MLLFGDDSLGHAAGHTIPSDRGASPLTLSALKARHAQGRVAVLSIDHQYLFRKWLGLDQQKDQIAVFDSFTAAYCDTLTRLRHFSLPVVHVAFSHKAHGAYQNDMSPADRRDIHAHMHAFHLNKQGVITRNGKETTRADLLHPVRHGDRLFIKNGRSALGDKGRNSLHHTLRLSKIDTLIVTGLYADACVLDTVKDAGHLGGYDVVLPCDMLYPSGKNENLIQTTRDNFDRFRCHAPRARTTLSQDLCRSLA